MFIVFPFIMETIK